MIGLKREINLIFCLKMGNIEFSSLRRENDLFKNSVKNEI